MFSRCRPPYTRPPARIDSTRGTPPPPPPSSTALSHHLVPISGLNIYSRPTYMYNQGVEPFFGKLFIGGDYDTGTSTFSFYTVRNLCHNAHKIGAYNIWLFLNL